MLSLSGLTDCVSVLLVFILRYYRRPIPSKPPTPSTIGGWEKALEIQVYLACVLTSAFFVFCSGELEAWSEVWRDTVLDPLPTDTELREGSWQGCVPIAQVRFTPNVPRVLSIENAHAARQK